MATMHNYHVFRPYEYRDHDEDEQEQRLRPKPKPRPQDLFKPHIRVCYEYLSATAPPRNLFHLSHPTTTIACQSFFGQEGEHYLHTHLSPFRFFTHERIQRVIPGIRREVQRVFGINDDDMMMMMSDAASSSTTANVESSNEEPPREVSLILAFEFEVRVDDVEGNVLEQTMSNVVGMVPASEETMLTLLRKPNKAVEREQHCTICMEGYDDDDINGGSEPCAMPCDHVFHRQCIVQWLRISHVCPLCRYAMPTVHVNEFIY